jgi:uncharacterized damage-inducible protein DinB
MTFVDAITSAWAFNRERTDALIGEIRKESDPQATLDWRPGDGRAHIGWQLMHIAVTEEVIAKERLTLSEAGFGDLIERFRGGSTPDENVPTLDEICETLTAGREHLLEVASSITDEELQTIRPGLEPRGWTVQKALQIISWHEAHHHGQAHITLNLFRNQ